MYSNSPKNFPTRSEKIEDHQNAIEDVLLLTTTYLNLYNSHLVGGQSADVIVGVESALLAAIKKIEAGA